MGEAGGAGWRVGFRQAGSPPSETARMASRVSASAKEPSGLWPQPLGGRNHSPPNFPEIVLPFSAWKRRLRLEMMAYHLTTPTPGKSAMRPKNRVWGFSSERRFYPLGSRRRCPELRRKSRPTPTIFTPGIPHWPSRDPIGERGGVNLYGFVGNDGINRLDCHGLLTHQEAGEFIKDINFMEGGRVEPGGPRGPNANGDVPNIGYKVTAKWKFTISGKCDKGNPADVLAALDSMKFSWDPLNTGKQQGGIVGTGLHHEPSFSVTQDGNISCPSKSPFPGDGSYVTGSCIRLNITLQWLNVFEFGYGLGIGPWSWDWYTYKHSVVVCEASFEFYYCCCCYKEEQHREWIDKLDREANVRKISVNNIPKK